MSRKREAILMSQYKIGRLSVVVVSFAILITIANIVTYTFQRNKQNQFAKGLLSHAESVTNQLASSLLQIKQNQLSVCDNETINQLRVISNKLPYVYDLGIEDKNQVICTANWGVLEKPFTLPENKFTTPSGYHLYSNLHRVFPINLVLDITRLNQGIAFTIPNAFKRFEESQPDFSFEIKMKDREHVFVSYQSKNQVMSSFSHLKLNTTTCSTMYSYCVNTFNKRAGIFYYSNNISTSIILLCLAVSFLLTYSYQSYRDKRRSMEFRLRKAIANDKIYMEYQPIICVESGRVIGVESLIRWHDEIFGRVSPELFLSVAHKLSLYPEISDISTVKSIGDMAETLQEDASFSLSINVDSFEIQSDNYLDFLHSVVSKYGISTSQIKIEITERIGLPLCELAAFSKQAREHGFNVALDDFGTGVANLVWLTEIDFDVIKIDRVFTQSLTNDMKQKMIFAILDLIDGLNKTVIFEGVETKAEYDLIKSRSPEALVQGWYFYKSLPKQEIRELLIKQDA